MRQYNLHSLLNPIIEIKQWQSIETLVASKNIFNAKKTKTFVHESFSAAQNVFFRRCLQCPKFSNVVFL